VFLVKVYFKTIQKRTPILTQFRQQFVIATGLIRRQHQNAHRVIGCWLLQLQCVQNALMQIYVNVTNISQYHIQNPRVKMHKYDESKCIRNTQNCYRFQGQQL